MISIKDYVYERKQELAEKVRKCNFAPVLAVIQVNHIPASDSYIKGKKKDCEEVGIFIQHVQIDSAKVEQKEFEQIVRNLANCTGIDGIIIQLPIPKKYDLKALMNLIPASKDVDGFRRDSSFDPCTPKGIIDWMEYNKYPIAGSNVVVLGRSEIVGKPLVNMLIDRGATVTCCNSRSENIADYLIFADVVISAIGRPKYWDTSYFCSRTDLIVDVGINRQENGKLCGDVDSARFAGELPDTYVTPVPGGVGLLTRLALVENVYNAYRSHLL